MSNSPTLGGEDPRRAELRTLGDQLLTLEDAQGPDWVDEANALVRQINNLYEELGDPPIYIPEPYFKEEEEPDDDDDDDKEEPDDDEQEEPDDDDQEGLDDDEDDPDIDALPYHPLTEQEINALPTRLLTEPDKGDDGDITCRICWEDNLAIGEVVTTLRCKHWYHTACIGRSLASNPTCPLCRRHVLRDR